MRFVRHEDELVYVRRLNKWLLKSNNIGTPSLACCCLCKAVDSHSFVQDAEFYEQELNWHVR